MDGTKLINKICPQLQDQPLWRQLFEAIVDLANNGEFIESPFKDSLRNRGFLKESTVSFNSTADNLITPAYPLPKGKYISLEVTPYNSQSNIFTENTTLFVGTPGRHKITAVEFYPTEFYDTYLSVIGPETFTITSLMTLMQAAYICGVPLGGISFEGVGYWVKYSIKTLCNFGPSYNYSSVNTEEFYTKFNLISYSYGTDPAEWQIGDIIVPAEGSVLTPRKVLSYSNGVAIVEKVEGEDSLQNWSELNVQRYFCGYLFNGSSLSIDNEILKRWFDHDAPIQISARVTMGLSVNPLRIQLDFSKDSSGATAGVSISGNETYQFDLSNFNVEYFELKIGTTNVVEGQLYKAPTALKVIAKENNYSGSDRTCSFEIVTSGGVHYTVEVVQLKSGVIVEVTHDVTTETVLIYGNAAESNPFQISKQYPSSLIQENYVVIVKSILPFKIGVLLKSKELFWNTNTAAEWVDRSWNANSGDKVVNGFTPLEVEGKITPSGGQSQYEAVLKLPGYDPQMGQMGDSLLTKAFITIYDNGEHTYDIISQTCQNKSLQTTNKPVRVQGGMAFQAVRRSYDGMLLAAAEWGSYEVESVTSTYTKKRNGTLFEQGKLINVDDFHGGGGYSGCVILFGCSDSVWNRLKFRFVVIDESRDIWEEVSTAGAKLEGTHGLVCLKQAQYGGTYYKVSVEVCFSDTPLVVPGINMVQRKWVDVTGSNPYYVYNRLWTFAAQLPQPESEQVHTESVLFDDIVGGYPGMNVRLGRDYPGAEIKAYQEQNNIRLLGFNLYQSYQEPLEIDDPDSEYSSAKIINYKDKRIYLNNTSVVKLTRSASGSPSVLYGGFTLEAPKDSIVILCGFGNTAFGNTDMLDSPLSFIGRKTVDAQDINLHFLQYPLTALGALFFNSSNPLSPRNVIWQGLLETGVQMQGTGAGFNTSTNKPSGSWNCWYSSSIMVIKPKNRLTQLYWETAMAAAFSASQWWGSWLSGTNTFYMYGYSLPISGLTQAQIDLLDSVKFTGRTLKEGVVYSPLDLSTSYYNNDNITANSIIESLVQNAIQNNYIDSDCLVQIPVSVKFSNAY